MSSMKIQKKGLSSTGERLDNSGVKFRKNSKEPEFNIFSSQVTKKEIKLNKNLGWRNIVAKSALSVLGGSIGLSVADILKNCTEMTNKKANALGIVAGCIGAVGMTLLTEDYCQKNRLDDIIEPIFIKE